MSINDVAKYLGISRFRVSRYLKEAREKGIVQIRIRESNAGYERLALQLEQALPIRRVLVLPTPFDGDRDTTRRVIGEAAAPLLNDVTPETTIAITWGRTVASMVENLPDNELKAGRVIELAGGGGHITERMSAHAVSLQTAEKLKAECVQVPAPVIADDPKTARAFLDESSIRRALEMATRADVAITGVGPMDLDSLVHRSGFLSEDDFHSLRKSGAVGSIFGRFYDIDGKECVTTYQHRSVSLTFDEFIKIPERIALAGGSNKVQSIIGLLRGGLITTLVTDAETANALQENYISEAEVA